MPQDGIGDSARRGVDAVNPFTHHDQPSRSALLTYKILTPLAWLLLVITSFYYTLHAPEYHHDHDHPHPHNPNKHPHGHPHATPHHHYGHHYIPFWQHNPPTPFAQSPLLTSIYWLLLFLFQLGYTLHFFSSDSAYVAAAANVAPHYLASQLLLFAFVLLWVRAFAWIALLILIVNFFNLSIGYFRYPTTPRLVHIAVLSGPLAWNFVALYWAGAVAVGAHSLAARIVANVFIWGVLGYGVFFLAAYKDYTIGFALSIMTASTGVGQFLVQHHAVLNVQWIFAFTIMAVLFLLSVAVGLDWNVFPRGAIVSEDQERAPLLSPEEDRA